MAMAIDSPRGALGLVLVGVVLLLALMSPRARLGAVARPDKETREKFYGDLVTGSTRNSTGEGSIAEMFDRVLEKEFSENDSPEGKGVSSLSHLFDQDPCSCVIADVVCVLLARRMPRNSYSKNLVFDVAAFHL